MPGFADIGSLASGLASSISSGTLIDDETLKESAEGTSLLTLKSQALLSYLHNLALVATGQVLRQHPDGDNKLAQQMIDYGRKASVTQRVVLEKGVKGLESKLSYQLDKALRAYQRAKEQAEQAELTKATGGSNSDDSENESESESEVETFRPNVSGLIPANRQSDDEESDEESNAKALKKYQAPKIAATSLEQRPKHRKRNFAMEEYLRESGDAPRAEPSIGSAIMDHGQGGERTEHERRKQQEIDDYEESNFTRIQQVSSKQARRDARQRAINASSRSLFGEDWGFVENQPAAKKRRATGNGKKSKKRR